jgi:hypothetical protein
MPGSTTAPGRAGARSSAPVRIAFRQPNGVGTRDDVDFAAQWLAYAIPYRRFAEVLADNCARLGADVVCYTFIAADLHHLLLAGLPAHSAPDPMRDVGNGATPPFVGEATELCFVRSHAGVTLIVTRTAPRRIPRRLEKLRRNRFRFCARGVSPTESQSRTVVLSESARRSDWLNDRGLRG